MPPYGMMSPYGDPTQMCGPYDKRFFTQAHYPTPYHEQLYMNEVAEGVPCQQEYMAPQVNPYATPPGAAMYAYPNHGYPMPHGGYSPQMWRNEEDRHDESTSGSS